MQYCNKSLIKNNNEILQYFNKNNDIALVMHQCALLDMSDLELCMQQIVDETTTALSEINDSVVDRQQQCNVILMF